MVKLPKPETKLNYRSLEKLQEQEKYLRNLKSFIENRLFRLQIEELNIKSHCRNKRLKFQKMKLQEEAKAEKCKQVLEVENTVRMASPTDPNIRSSSPQTSMRSCSSYAEYLEPVELTTAGLDDLRIESDDDDTVF